MKSQNIKTNEVRFSYVNVFEKTGYEDNEKKYNIQILIPKTDKIGLKIITDAVDIVIKDNKLEKKKLKRPNPLYDGDEKPGKGDERKGMMFFTAKSNRQPQVVNEVGVAITQDSGDLYSGCWGRATLQVFAYTKGGGGISIGLGNIMKTKDDERFDGATNAEEDFKGDFKVADDFLR